MRRWTLLAGSLAVVVAAVAALGFALRGPSVRQPIAFNHKLHLGDAGMECTDCHLYAKTGVRATIPNYSVCAGCHESPQTDSPEEARLVHYIQASQPIPWRKVYWLPDHVYFSHRRHTQLAGLACETCHGAMRERAQPLTRPLVRLSMAFCLDCHQRTGAANDCVLCHR